MSLIIFLDTKNKWSTFGIKSPNEDCQNWSSYENESITGGLMTYKNLVLSLNTTKDDQNLFVAIMNIESIRRDFYVILIVD